MFSKLWNFMRGNKTILGLVFLQLSSAPFMPESWITSVDWFGSVLTTVGVVDKGIRGFGELKSGNRKDD